MQNEEVLSVTQRQPTVRSFATGFVGDTWRQASMMVWKEAVDDMVYCKEFTASSAAKISPPYALYRTSSNFRYDLHDREDSSSLSPIVRLDEMHHKPTLILRINTSCKDIARAARGACTGSKQASFTECLVQTGMRHTVHQAALII